MQPCHFLKEQRENEKGKVCPIKNVQTHKQAQGWNAARIGRIEEADPGIPSAGGAGGLERRTISLAWTRSPKGIVGYLLPALALLSVVAGAFSAGGFILPHGEHAGDHAGQRLAYLYSSWK